MKILVRSLPASSLLGAGFLLVIAFLGVFGSHLGFQDPYAQDYAAVFQPPSAAHWLGTDDLGRDTLARLVSACRVAVGAVLLAMVIGVVLGVPLGIAAGLFKGTVDQVLSRTADAVLAFPPLILAIGIVGVLGPSLRNAMIAIGVVFVPILFRVTRGATLVVSQEGYIEAARVTGARAWFLIHRHIFKNVLPPIVTQICLLAATAMIAEASLSFIGLGVQPPQSSWGSMLGRAVRTIDSSTWAVVLPGLAIALTSLSFLLLGDGIREMAQRRTSHARKVVTS